MNKKFTKLIAALALLVFMMPTMAGWGQSTVTFDATTDITANAQSYQTDVLTINAADESTWHATGYGATANTNIVIGKGGANYLETPSVNGTISEVAVTWSGNTSYYLALQTTDGTELSNYQNPSTSTTKIFTVSGSYSQLRLVGRRASGTSNAAATITKVVVTYTTSGGGGGSQATATTTTIDATGITNTDLNTSAAAGSLSATVSANNTPIEGATVTWSGNNNAVATIDSDGVVTLVGAGTVTFTATYAGVSGTYQPSSDTYQMTVTYQPTTIEITPNFTFWGKTSSFSGTDFSDLTASKDNVSLHWTRGNGSMYANSTAMRFYKDNDLTFTAPTGYEIKSIVLDVSGTFNDLSFSLDGWNLSTKTWSGAATTVTMSRPSNASSYSTISKFTITIGLPKTVAMPTFSLAAGTYGGTQNVTISCETDGTTIYFTTDGTTPSASNGTQGASVTITENTTLKAIAIKDDEESDVATAQYTILSPLTTMEDIFNEANTNTSSHTVAITFDEWVVTGTASTTAYVTDGTRGFVISQSGHGFAAGNILNGTAICKLELNTYGCAQVKELTSASFSDVPTGGLVAPVVTTMSELTPANVGSIVTLKDVTCTKYSYYYFLNDGENYIMYNTTVSPSYSNTWTENKTYDVTGVYWITYGANYDETHTTGLRITSKAAADIVLKADLDIDASMTPFSYIVNNGPSAAQNIVVICTDLGSNTLTVTASSDYEVSLASDGTYTQYVEMSGEVAETVYVRLKAGLSVGEHNGTVTFTATNLTTTTVNLEGLVSTAQTYAIDLTQPTGGIATISSDVAVAEADATITLSYSDVDDCYEFSEWSVMYELGEEDYEIIPDENNQFTMPAADVYVSAIFVQKTFTVNYSVNGTVYEALKTTGIVCGSAVTLKTAADLTAASITLPTGYSFTGWSTSAGSSEIISSFTPDADATLYAVLIPSVSAGYVKVTSLDDITAGTYFIVNDGYVLPNATTDANTPPAKNNNYKITTPLSDSYNSLPIAGTEWTFTGSNTGMTIKNGSDSYLYATNVNNGVRVYSTSDTWAFETNGAGFAMKDANNNRYCATYKDGSDWRSYTSANHTNYGDGGVLYLYKKETPAVYTRIEEITLTETLPSIEPTYLITVENGGVLTLTGPNNGDASNLIVKDGGQLKIYASSAKGGEVQATMEKNIAAWTTDTPVGGWYFIASPIDANNLNPEVVDNLITDDDEDNNHTFDLYKYVADNVVNEEPKPWYNYRAHSFVLANGQGYLYANASAQTLAFAGAVKPYSEENNANQVAVDAGWNLIGNPYTFNTYVNQGYYKLNNDRTAIEAMDDNADIAPCTGIIVKAVNSGNVTFSENKSGGSKGSVGIRLSKAGTRSNATLDNAIVSFNVGSQLEKFYFMQQNANLYIPQGIEEYAIVNAQAQGEMPVNFRANENGQYTLTVNAENVEMNYLHLIDNMTGADIDLLQTPSYTFNAKTYDYESRFRLVFAANSNDNASAGSETFAFFANGNLIINNEGEATLQVIDMTGRVLRSEAINGSASIGAKSLATGVYVLRLVNGNNIKTQKMVMK